MIVSPIRSTLVVKPVSYSTPQAHEPHHVVVSAGESVHTLAKAGATVVLRPGAAGAAQQITVGSETQFVVSEADIAFVLR